MVTWLRRLAYLLRQSRHDAELREEIEAHRSLRAAHLEREGLTPGGGRCQPPGSRRRPPGPRRCTRRVARIVGYMVAGHSIRSAQLPQKPGVYFRCGADACTRHWSQHRHFQRRQRRPLPRSPRPARTSSCRPRSRFRAYLISQGARRSRLPSTSFIATARRRSLAWRPMPTRGGSDARRRHSAKGPGRARQLQLLRRAAATSGARSRVR